MGLFDKLFEKKYCDICGGEIGLLGNRKLEDGNCCKSCAKKLSPWFEERRHSTVEQIRAQLAYREENERQLATFQVSQIIGDAYKMYVEEVGGVPTRFFVCDEDDYMRVNPDIIDFKNVLSCTTDIRTFKKEMKQKNSEGNMVSYNPPRYEVDHDFYIEMTIGNIPWFDDISFYVNSGTVTLETTEMPGMLGNIFGAAFGNNIANRSEQQRYDKYEAMCRQIEQLVQLGKSGICSAAPAANAPAYAAPAAPAYAPPVAPPPAAPAYAAPVAPSPAEPAAPAVPKFCPNCGAPTQGGKFCSNCGTRF